MQHQILTAILKEFAAYLHKNGTFQIQGLVCLPFQIVNAVHTLLNI